MAQFSVKTGQIRSLAGDAVGIAQELAGYADSIGRIANSLSFNSGKAAGIRARLRSASQNTSSHRTGMSGLGSALTAVVDKYDDAERRTVDKLGEISGQSDILSKIVPELGKNYGLQDTLQSAYKVLTGMVGAAAGVLGSNVFASWGKELLGNIWKTVSGWIGKGGNTTDKVPTAPWGDRVCPLPETWDNTASEPEQPAPAGPPRYEQPEYAKQDLAPNADGTYGPYVHHKNGTLGRVSEWNRPGQLSCTYYTLRKLNERGLSFPCTGGPGNGRDWYEKFDKDSGLPHYPGSNALNDLVGNLKLPQANVVVSFQPNHVLLIDEIYKEGDIVKVKYSDQWYYDAAARKTKYIDNINGSNPTLTRTLDEFLASYTNRNGVTTMNGAAVIGAGTK